MGIEAEAQVLSLLRRRIWSCSPESASPRAPRVRPRPRRPAAQPARARARPRRRRP
jgi:hypothetical protein